MNTRASNSGFTLVELMISMTLSLLVLAALVGLFVNTSRSGAEMAKTNALIENGRFAVQLVEEDLVHGGYWGGYIPQFDDLTSTTVPDDAPNAVPNPCEDVADWDSDYRNNLLGIPVHSYETLPAGAGCLGFAAFPQRLGTDVLVVRHAKMCL